MPARDTSIPSTMRSVRCHGIRDYRIEHVPTVPPPGLGPKDLLIRVSRCGICASDVKCFHGAPMFWGDSTRTPYVQTPVTPGHEFCGVIVDGHRDGFQIGDSVTAEQIVACGDCFYCYRGMRWLCVPHDIFGFHTNVNGGLAEYMVLPARARVHKLPNQLGVDQQVLVEPLSCAVHGVERAGIEMGDVVVVSGTGPIGLGMVAAAKRRFPGRLVAVDMMDERLDIARECGADICLNPSKENAVEKIKQITGGIGCDVYLEAAGHPSSVQQGLQMCRKAATFVEFSVFGSAVTVDWTVIGDTKELNIKGGHLSGERGYEVAIAMLAEGSMPTERIVSHNFPLGDMLEGFSQVKNGKGSVKVTVDPTLA